MPYHYIAIRQKLNRVACCARARTLLSLSLSRLKYFFLLFIFSQASLALSEVTPPKIDLKTPSGMSIPDAEFRIDATDLVIGSMKLERFSQGPSMYWPDYSQFGAMMSSNFDIYVQTNIIKATGKPFPQPAHRHATVHIGNSSYSLYYITGTSGGGIISNDNTDSYGGALTWSGASFQFIDKTGSVYTFSSSVSAHPSGAVNYGATGGAISSQRIDNIKFLDGRVWQFYYDSGQRPKLVTDSGGYAILFDYGANGFVSDACAIDRSRFYVTASSNCSGQPVKVSYQYGSGVLFNGTAATVLTGITDVRGQTTLLSHSAIDPAVSCVVPPGYTSCQMQLSTDGRQTLADGSVWNVSTSGGRYTVNDPEIPADTSYSANVVDPAGYQTNYIFSGSSPLKITDYNGNITTFKWCCSQTQEVNSPATFSGSMLMEADFPEGNKYLAYYAGPYNLISRATLQAKPGSGLADQVVTYDYGATLSSGAPLAKPTAQTDANGNQTNWTYTDFGSVASEMGPAPSPGAARPLKVYTYIQKSVSVLNAVGALVSTGQPIWMPSTETECQTANNSSTPTCDGAATQRITTYQYGPDGTPDALLVRGVAVTADGQTLRTCYTYDAQSRKVSTTLPRAGLGVCP